MPNAICTDRAGGRLGKTYAGARFRALTAEIKKQIKAFIRL